MRCMHEASLYDENSFITLTYDEDNLPSNGSLKPRDLQLFMKRLRKHVWKHERKHLRFYGCGEYGDESKRPHYHALLFGHDFGDKIFYKHSRSGEPIFTSETLTRLWDKGHAPIGSVTFESAGYVARYVLKKRNGPEADQYYDGRVPEFSRMSRGHQGGIGRPWLVKWKKDVYPHDYVVVNGKRCKPPAYYDTQMCPDLMEEIKSIRKERAAEHEDNNTPERLAVREEIQKIKQDRLLRREI